MGTNMPSSTPLQQKRVVLMSPAVAAIVQYRLYGDHNSGSAANRGGPADHVGLVYLDDAPNGKDGRPREEGALEMVRRAVWGMLYADDVGMVSTSPHRVGLPG